jgi:hypothetical protein
METRSDTIKVFISHTSADSDLALSLIRLIRAGLHLTETDIRCTSVDGYKLEPGADTEATLRREVNDSTVLLGLLTPASIHSSYVLFELGARWGIERSLIPVLGYGASYSSLPGPLQGRNAIRASERGELEDMLFKLSKDLGVELARASAYGADLASVIEEASKKKLTRQRRSP